MDSEILYVEALQHLLKEKNLQISTADAIRIVYGKSFPSVYEQVKRRFPNVFATMESMEKPLRSHFLNIRGTRDVRIESSIELLKKLSTNYPVCIVSGNTRHDVELAVDQMDIRSNIQFSISCEDYSHTKPHPQCFILAAKKLKLPPHRCMVFEDAAAGIQAAKNAGMFCIALQRKNTPQQDTSNADEVLDDLSEFDIKKWSRAV